MSVLCDKSLSWKLCCAISAKVSRETNITAISVILSAAFLSGEVFYFIYKFVLVDSDEESIFNNTVVNNSVKSH